MPAICVQGTASGVGKSTIVAALCRILRRRGVRVAPFKAVNFTLNSAVTPDGLEIGRAQAVQAQAAGLEPRVEMNPVLVKPGPRRHVVVMGRPSKAAMWPAIRRAYRALAGAFDVVVIEGMGSAAEPNLMPDLANHRIAREAMARVLLVGDIERGGVFASLLGSWEIMPVKPAAFVINKFRGRGLDGAVCWLERRTRVPVAAVVPWLDLALDEEDTPREVPSNGRLRIAVVKLPHLSNSTDFEPLQREPDVDLRYVSRPVDCDALIFPGSKAPVADLSWVRSRFDRLEAPEIVGICGGLQILGKRLARAEGLGLFNAVTTFAPRKRTVRVRGTAMGAPIEGYEIHTGRTRIDGRPFAELESGPDGVVTDRGWGTYVHGVFDSPAFRRAWLDRLRGRRGWRSLAPRAWSRDAEIDTLADAVEKSLDMKFVMGLL